MDLTPICVDLDGTLLKSDSLFECFLDACRRDPKSLLSLPGALFKGRAATKESMARAPFDAATLPYRTELLEDLRAARQSGRSLVLCTAANREIANAVAEHLQIFDDVFASDETCNLKGAAKRDLLEKEFGARKFDYAGDHAADLAIWEIARKAWVVDNGGLLGRLGRTGADVENVYRNKSAWRAFLKAIRLHQWSKNVLIFLPLMLAHQFTNIPYWVATFIEFVSFGLIASAGYLVNDLLDRRDDRRHQHKRKRPFASGDLPLSWGLAAPAMVAAAFALALWLPVRCAIISVIYLAATLSYSSYLKKQPILDVITLASLYSIRLIAGAAATATPLSMWLMSFSTFIFLSLALSKRVAEFRVLQKLEADRTFGRGYRNDDVPILEMMGVSSGFTGSMVLLTYLNGAEVARLYRSPQYLWALLPLTLLWISRLWLKAHRQELIDDPMVYALRDPMSLAIGAVAALAVLAAI